MLPKKFWKWADLRHHLQESGLWNVEVDPDGVEALSRALQGEVELSLWDLDDEGVKALAQALETNQTLQELNLEDNQIGDEGAKALAQVLETNQSLQELNLEDNRIGDEGAEVLGQALRNNGNLKFILLIGNPISATVAQETIRNISAVRPRFWNFDGPGFGSRSFELLHGLDCEQDLEVAYQKYSKELVWDNLNTLDNLAWLYRSGCGTEVSIAKAKQCLAKAIANYKSPSAMFLLADILASSTNPADLRNARDWIGKIPNQGNNVFWRAQWLLPYIEDQEELFTLEAIPELRPDCVLDAELQIVALIGQGQFGKVYLARRRQQKWVAVKFQSVDLVLDDDKSQVRHVLHERFACRMIDSQKIPNMVKYVGFVDDLGNMQRGLVFELCADLTGVIEDAEAAVQTFVSARFVDLGTVPDWTGRVWSSLRSAVVHAPRRRWGVSAVIGMLRKVAEALLSLHKCGFVHRDIADRNVLCDDQGNVQLADLGLAHYFGGAEAKYDTIMEYRTYLTPGNHYAVAWWAPECIGNEDYNAIFSTQSDIYSFGVLMWQCFTHRDPFDDVKPASESAVDRSKAAGIIMSRILNDKRPDLKKLDSDTPSRLKEIITQCWEADPQDRPTLELLIAELVKIMENPTDDSRYILRNRRSKDAKTKWFDVARMYWSLPLRQQHQGAVENTTARDSTSFSSILHERRLRALKHDVAPCDTLEPHILGQFPFEHRPRDVFLLHTGAQKCDLVATLQDAYESCNLKCFLDMDMRAYDGSPSESMRFALETCRHVVIVISQEFLARKAPCQELKYVYDRMEWIREQHSGMRWQSLWVVLYDLTVDQYQRARETNPQLPDICRNACLREYVKSRDRNLPIGYRSWPNLHHEMKADIIYHDKEQGAVVKWKKWLKQWGSLDNTFPRANWVYGPGEDAEQAVEDPSNSCPVL